MQASTMSASVRTPFFAQLALFSVSLVEMAQNQREQDWARDINDAGFELQTLETIETSKEIEGKDKIEPAVASRIEMVYRNVAVNFITAGGKVAQNGAIKSEETVAAYAKIVEQLEQIVNSKAPHASAFKLAYEAAKRALGNKTNGLIAHQAVKQVFDLIGDAFLTLTRQNANYALMN